MYWQGAMQPVPCTSPCLTSACSLCLWRLAYMATNGNTTGMPASMTSAVNTKAMAALTAPSDAPMSRRSQSFARWTLRCCRALSCCGSCCQLEACTMQAVLRQTC